MTIQQPGRVPDRQTRQMQIDFIVGQHEADALVLADRAAEGVTPSGIFRCNGVAAPRRAKPAHTMGQARGTKPDLCVAETLADLPQHAIGRDVNILERDLGVSTGRVGVDRFQHAVDAKAGRVHVDKEHCRSQIHSPRIERARHDDVNAGLGNARNHPLAAIDHKSIGHLLSDRLQQ